MQFCAPKFLKIPKSQCPHIFEHVFHDTNGRNHGRTLKIPWLLLNEMCTDTTRWSLVGITVRRSSDGCLMEKSTEL